MLIVFCHNGVERELEIVAHDSEARVADLAGALLRTVDVDSARSRPLTSLVVDGRPIDGQRRLLRAGMLNGSRVEVGTYPESPGQGRDGRSHDPRLCDAIGSPWALDIVGGLDSGRTLPLASGRWPVGRFGTIDLAHPTVSARHATLDVTTEVVKISDCGSRNGTWLGHQPVHGPTRLDPTVVTRLGAVQVAVRSVEPRRSAKVPMPVRSPSIPLNRPPRTRPPLDPDLIDPPDPPAANEPMTHIGVVAVLAPLVMGLVMIKVFGSLLFGLFALLSPVMLIGSAVESRRRRRTGGRRDRLRFDRDMTRFEAELAASGSEYRRRLETIAPDPAEVLARVRGASTRLWERRPGHHDFLRLRIGIADIRWTPPVTGEPDRMEQSIRSAMDRAAVLETSPVVADFTRGAILGLVGHRGAALAVARSLLLQAATHHGPADLAVVVVTATDRTPDWDWTKWLPHTADPARSGQRRLGSGETADEILRNLLAERLCDRGDGVVPQGAEVTTLLVVDDESLTSGRRSPARSVLRGLAGPVAGIVVASTEDRLPALCNLVLDLTDGDGTAHLVRLDAGDCVDDVLAAGVSETTARDTARSMARFEDPESESGGASLPTEVALLSLLGPGSIDAIGMADRWDGAEATTGLLAPIGVTEDGVLAIDLVADGPHALVAGTTGSGKSELLRTLVASLAANHSPENVNFVLIDFKGGSAFDRCALLPHTVGLVTDLDPHLAARALRCMEAELRHREQRLREAGAPDILSFNRLRRGAAGHGPAGANRAEPEPMPRLVVVIDEFATLKAEVPDFVDALVGVAQRGRSLGVHLVLATQRPSGAVSDNIRANTNLRIALRVQDAADSSDVIDVADAALIGRSQPGRALARLGPGETVLLQTALCTGHCDTDYSGLVELRSFGFGPSDRGSQAPCVGSSLENGIGADGGDLARLVIAATAAHRLRNGPIPRRPWPDPLPPEVDLRPFLGSGPAPDRSTRSTGSPLSFGTPGTTVHFALADDPDAQDQYPTGWDPSVGNLLMFGIPGSGLTTACASLVLTVAATHGPDDVHIHLLDFGAGTLAGLGSLPQVGSVVGPGERERQSRLIALLRSEIERRRALDPSHRRHPRVLLILDGMGGFRNEWDEAFLGVSENLSKVFTDGPEVGVHTVITADRLGAVPSALQSLARQRWLFRMAEAHDYSGAGLAPGSVPDLGPGGAVLVESRLEVRVARPTGGHTAALVTEISARWPDRSSHRPPTVEALPHEVEVDAVAGHARFSGDLWFVPIGVGERHLSPTGFTLHPGEHALVAGPSRSGRSSTLLAVAAITGGARAAPAVMAVASSRSPLGRSPHLDRVIDPGALTTAVPALLIDPEPLLLLIDDAELIVDDQGMALERLLAARRPDLHIVAAGRSESLRSLYLHWTRTIRHSRCVLLLQPDLDLDGDLAAVTLPRRSVATIGTGRGYLVEANTLDLVQVALDSALPTFPLKQCGK